MADCSPNPTFEVSLGGDPVARGNVPRVIALTSGKGGVGKTVLAANLAVAFARRGKRVLLIDADLGLGSLSLLFGLANPLYGLKDFFSGDKQLREILVPGPEGVQILPAGTGGQATTRLSSTEKLVFLEALNQLHADFDLILIDTGAGLSENSVYFTVAAHAILVVTTPEPASLAQAASLMQLLAGQHQEKRFHLVINAGRNEQQALKAFERLTVQVGGSPGFSILYLGFIPFEGKMGRSTLRRRTMIQFGHEAPASQYLALLCERLGTALETIQPKGNLQFFWPRMMTDSPARPRL